MLFNKVAGLCEGEEVKSAEGELEQLQLADRLEISLHYFENARPVERIPMERLTKEELMEELVHKKPDFLGGATIEAHIPDPLDEGADVMAFEEKSKDAAECICLSL